MQIGCFASLYLLIVLKAAKVKQDGGSDEVEGLLCA